VETDMDDLHVEPSQGTHFFQNVTSFGISYFSVSSRSGIGMVDNAWLGATPAETENQFIRHLALDGPLEIVVNGRRGFGAVMKPGCSVLPAETDRS
jgi:hypothetical protein